MIINRKGCCRGFTLIEMAIVLVIIGLLIGMGASMIGPLTKRAKTTEIKEMLNADVESVIGFAVKNNRLPARGEFSYIFNTSGNSVAKYTNDAWGRPIEYFVDIALTNQPQDPSEGICGRSLTNSVVCFDANCTNQIQNVAFLVVSGGENFNVQTGPLTGSPCPSGKTCYRVYPQDTKDVDDYSRPPNPASGDPGDPNRLEPYYDDIVKWVTLDELRIEIGCQGAQLKILNNELPYGYKNNPYDATVYAEGGVPFTSGGKYNWCVQGNLPSGLSLTPSVVPTTNCSSAPGTSWGQGDALQISGTPSSLGAYSLTFFVRDNQGPNNNIAQKTLVLTINP